MFVFVRGANAHHTEYLEFVYSTDGRVCETLDFCNLSGCEQLVRGATLLHDNRLDLVLTDVPNIVDISIGSLLGTSDRCLVRCELLGKQNILEHKVRHLVNLNNETTQTVYMVQSEALIWITILRSPNPVETL